MSGRTRPVVAARRATTGHRVRPYAWLGAEPSMAVYLYAWEKTGPVAQLADRMTLVLAARFHASE